MGVGLNHNQKAAVKGLINPPEGALNIDGDLLIMSCIHRWDDKTQSAYTHPIHPVKKIVVDNKTRLV